MENVILSPDGSIDWNKNGWPNPNSAMDANYEGYSTESMPDDVFDLWQTECENMEDEWEIDW